MELKSYGDAGKVAQEVLSSLEGRQKRNVQFFKIIRFLKIYRNRNKIKLKAIKLLVYQSKVCIFNKISSNLTKLFHVFVFSQHKNWSLIKLRQLSTSNANYNTDLKTPLENKTQSTPPPPQPKRSGSGALKFFAFAVTGFTIGLGYATLNPDARKQVESVIPQSSYLFDYVDGLIKDYKPSIQQPPKPKEIA